MAAWKRSLQAGAYAVRFALRLRAGAMLTPAPVSYTHLRAHETPEQWTGPGGRPATWRSSDYSSRAFCSTCGSSIGAIDDSPTIALFSGVFDDPDQSEFAPENHAFDDMMPAWWRMTIGNR